MRKTPIFLMVTCAALAISGCAKKPPPELPAPPRDLPQPPPPPTPAPTPTPMPSGPRAGSQADFLASVAADRVFFDTDKYDIDDEDMATLRSQAAWFARNPSVRFTIEGHCDERGTREYNLALGERRANAAKNYLASLGIDPARIATISYGKERPIALSSDESAWAQNRRAVSIVIE